MYGQQPFPRMIATEAYPHEWNHGWLEGHFSKSQGKGTKHQNAQWKSEAAFDQNDDNVWWWGNFWGRWWAQEAAHIIQLQAPQLEPRASQAAGNRSLLQKLRRHGRAGHRNRPRRIFRIRLPYGRLQDEMQANVVRHDFITTSKQPGFTNYQPRGLAQRV